MGEDITPEEIERQQKPKWYYAEDVVIDKVIVETALGDTNDLKRVRFECDRGVITYKLKKTKTQVSDKEGITLETDYRDTYTLGDLKTEFPVIVELASLVKKKPQQVTMSYTEQAFYNEREKEFNTYLFMSNAHAKTIYLEPIHKQDKSLIDSQLQRKKKFAEKEL